MNPVNGIRQTPTLRDADLIEIDHLAACLDAADSLASLESLSMKFTRLRVEDRDAMMRLLHARRKELLTQRHELIPPDRGEV